MKNSRAKVISKVRTRLTLAMFSLGLTLGTGGSSFAQTISDDFEDGDDLGWSQYDPIGAHPSFPEQAIYQVANGQFRIRTLPSPALPDVGPGRAGALRLDVTYTNFYVAVDFVTWNTNLDQAFGILARVTTPGLASTDGYAFTFQPGDGDISIARVKGEEPSDVSGTSKSVTILPGRPYRMVFLGKGGELEGRIYDLADPLTPIATTTGFHEEFPAGIAGLVVYDNSGSAGPQATDATFDNYLSLTDEPPRLNAVLDFGTVVISWPRTATGFALQISTEGGKAESWQDIDPFYIDVNDPDQFHYYIDASVLLPNSLFRLKK